MGLKRKYHKMSTHFVNYVTNKTYSYLVRVKKKLVDIVSILGDGVKNPVEG